MSESNPNRFPGGIYRLIRRQVLPAPIDKVWDFFSAPENLDQITPPNLFFEILSGGNEKIHSGQLIEYRIQFLPPLRSRWLTEITHLREPDFFIDEQRLGPYRFWQHLHRFSQVEGGTEMIDRVTYQLPFGLIGDLVHWIWIRHRLEQIFDFRSRQVGTIFPD